MTDHLGDVAALYALCALDERGQREAEAHLRNCEACRRLVARAEADVTAMEMLRPEIEPPVERPLRLHEEQRRPSAWLAAAAAIVIALLPAGYLLHENTLMRDEMNTQASAIANITSTPHRVVAFSGLDAHVMYAPDGSWYYIVIRGAREGLRVVWPHDGTQEMLGTATPHGEIASLYLPKSHRMDQLVLEKDGHVVGQAQLVF